MRDDIRKQISVRFTGRKIKLEFDISFEEYLDLYLRASVYTDDDLISYARWAILHAVPTLSSLNLWSSKLKPYYDRDNLDAERINHPLHEMVQWGNDVKKKQ